jgi:hypothetical protein
MVRLRYVEYLGDAGLQFYGECSTNKLSQSVPAPADLGTPSYLDASDGVVGHRSWSRYNCWIPGDIAAIVPTVPPLCSQLAKPFDSQ